MPTQADEARARLAEHVDYLRGQIRTMELLRPGLPTERMEFIAAAIERYLNREAATLDDAFGLAQPAHRPPSYVEMVAKAIPLRARPKPMLWKNIIYEVGYRRSAAEFSKLYKKHFDVAAQLLVDRWAADGMGD